MMLGTKKVGFLFLSIAMIAVGSTVIISKIIAESLSPFVAVLLRFGIASPVLLLIIYLLGQKIPKISKRDWGVLTIQAGLGSLAYTVLLMLGVSFTTAANASVIAGTLPIVMGVLAITMFGGLLTKRFSLSILIAFSGLLLVTLHGASTPNQNELVGIVFILLAVICEAFFMLLNKKLQNPLTAIVQSGLMSCIGFMLAIFPASYVFITEGFSTIETSTLLSITYYAIVPTIFGSTLWYAGAARTSASEAALTTAIMPVSSLFLSAAILSENISSQQILGCCLVVFAIFIGVFR